MDAREGHPCIRGICVALRTPGQFHFSPLQGRSIRNYVLEHAAMDAHFFFVGSPVATRRHGCTPPSGRCMHICRAQILETMTMQAPSSIHTTTTPSSRSLFDAQGPKAAAAAAG